MPETPAETCRFFLDALRRTMLHYGLWFAGTARNHGLAAALEAEREAGDRWTALTLKRLAKTLGVPLTGDGLPAPLADLPPETLQALAKAAAVNWLAADGVWFQAVESRHGMAAAKAVNDGCWESFSPIEARRIAALTELPPDPLEALKTALGYRLYARINEQEIVDETPTGFTFRMTRCRVQDARKRQGLADYPCKSGGMVEYTGFARTIAPGVTTTCLYCPPDPHPDDGWCAWRFERKG